MYDDDKTVLAERGNVRVVAERDEYPHKPERMGWPELIVGWDSRGGWSYMTPSWAGVIDERAVARAIDELAPGYDYDLLARWLRVHAADLINWESSGMELAERDIPEGVTVLVDTADGYMQGDTWLVLQWAPRNSEHWSDWKANESELVNWARGDAWVLVDQEYDTDADTWETVATHAVGGYFAQWPEDSSYMRDEAEGILEEAHDDYMEAVKTEARRYYEDLAVTQ